MPISDLAIETSLNRDYNTYRRTWKDTIDIAQTKDVLPSEICKSTVFAKVRMHLPMQNTTQYQKIAKNTVILYIRMLLNMIVTFYTSRIVLDAIGVEDYGIYNVVGGVVLLFSFLNTAMSSATQRFLTLEIGKKSDTESISKVFSTSLNIHSLIAFLILILSETAGLYFLNVHMVFPPERTIATNIVYHCSVISCCLWVIALPFNAIIISYERMSVFAWISIFDVALKLAVAYLLYLTPSDKLITYAVLTLFVSLITPTIYFAYCRKNFPECKYRHVKDKTLFKEMCNFAGWNFIGNFAYIGFTQGINILLNVFFGPAVNAARGIAVQMQGAIGQFSRNFQVAINPQITKQYAINDFENMHTLIYRSSKFSFFLLLLIALPVFLQTENILKWWLFDVPDYTIDFFRIIIFISMIDVLANPMNISAQATGKIKKYQLAEGSVLLLIVPFSYCALKVYNVPNIVFIVHFIIALIAQAIRITLLKHMIGLSVKKYMEMVIFKISTVLIASGSVIYFVYSICPCIIANFFFCTALSLFTAGTAIYLLGLSVSEKKVLIASLKKIFTKNE